MKKATSKEIQYLRLLLKIYYESYPTVFEREIIEAIEELINSGKSRDTIYYHFNNSLIILEKLFDAEINRIIEEARTLKNRKQELLKIAQGDDINNLTNEIEDLSLKISNPFDWANSYADNYFIVDKENFRLDFGKIELDLSNESAACQFTFRRIDFNLLEESLLKVMGKISAQSDINKKPSKSDHENLSLKQVALKYIYNGWHIKKEDANDIALEYGHSSGQKLLDHYYKNYNTSDRIGNRESKRKHSAQISDIQKILPFILPDKQERAKREIQTLLSFDSNDY